MPATFKLTIVTPESVALERTVESVTLPAYDGEIGVLANHAPMVARLGAGEVRIGASAGGAEQRLFIDGGVVQVRDNVATVLTNAAIAPEKLDANKARAELDETLARTPPNAAGAALRQADLVRARAKLRVAERIGTRK